MKPTSKLMTPTGKNNWIPVDTNRKPDKTN